MKYISITSIVISSVLALQGCSVKQEAKTETQTLVENDLPAMTITLLNGSSQSVKDLTGKTILILFQPDCDHCQREAKQIEENISKFDGYKLFFITSAPFPEIEKFSTDYNLKDKKDVHFAFTPTESVLNSFGPISAPSLYIYNAGKLIQTFNGEVAIEVVLKYI